MVADVRKPTGVAGGRPHDSDANGAVSATSGRLTPAVRHLGLEDLARLTEQLSTDTAAQGEDREDDERGDTSDEQPVLDS
jgi:hypothetical protein